MELYLERENLRNQIRTFWKEGRTWTANEFAVNEKLKSVHSEIIQQELLDETKAKQRIVYSVCGWSEKHAYFRSKRFVSENLKEAKAELKIAKKETYWNIPTIVIEETYFRKNSPAMADFDGDISTLGFSDTQEVIVKSMCGNRKFRWNNLIKEDDDRFTT